MATPLDLFPFTLGDAARRLVTNPEALAELVRLGELGAYLRPGEPGGPPPTLRFCEADLAAFIARDDTVSARLVAITGAALRAYLRARPPHRPATDTAPTLARDRGSAVFAHVQLEDFQAWLRGTTVPARPDDVRLHLTEVLRSTLRRLGCRPMRGIRPLHAPVQVWASWWRVPQAVWSLSLEELAPLRMGPPS